MTPAFLYDAVRTPFGRYAGGLSGVRPDDLAGHVVREVVTRTQLDPASIDDVVLGCANQAGEDNRNVARMAALLAGLPVSVPGTTINRLCGSGLDAAMAASRMVEVGDADVVLAGGVESMSRAPWVLPKPAHHSSGCRTVGASERDMGRGLPRMGVLTQPSRKTSTCPTLPSPAPT